MLNVTSKPSKFLIISITIHQIFTIFYYIFTKRILKDRLIFFQDYEAFFTAVERENLFSYLQLLAPPTEIEYQRSHQLPVKTEL